MYTIALVFYSIFEFDLQIHPSLFILSFINSYSSQSQSFFKISMNVLCYLPCFVCRSLATVKLSYVIVRRYALCSDLLVAIFFVLLPLYWDIFGISLYSFVLVTLSFYDIFVVILSNLV